MELEGNLLTVIEAAELLKVDKTRIGVLCRQGRFKGAKKISRIWLIPKEDILTFKRLPRGVKPKVPKREQDKALVINAINEMKEVGKNDE